MRKIKSMFVSAIAVLTLSACVPVPVQFWPSDGSDPVTLTYGDPEPALVVYRDRAAIMGWDPGKIAAWEPFVIDIMAKESGFCPNLRGGGTILVEEGCIIKKQGGRSDSGFGQVLMGYPGKRNWYRPEGGGTWSLHENAASLCPVTGVCTPDETIATPEASMDILLAMIDRAGSGPWCYSNFARRVHRCGIAPDR